MHTTPLEILGNESSFSEHPRRIEPRKEETPVRLPPVEANLLVAPRNSVLRVTEYMNSFVFSRDVGMRQLTESLFEQAIRRMGPTVNPVFSGACMYAVN